MLEGLQADVVSLALAADIDALARPRAAGQELAGPAAGKCRPYTSTIVLVVRTGNVLPPLLPSLLVGFGVALARGVGEYGS